MTTVLKSLATDEFLRISEFTLNPESLYSTLSRNPAVLETRRAVLAGEIGDEDVADFVARLIAGKPAGSIFEYDTTLAALAVALETVPEQWAHEYISGLASMEAPELPKSPKVARICIGKSC